MSKQQEDRFLLKDVYWAHDMQGEHVIPYIFNSTKSRVKRLDNGEILNIIVPQYGSPCKTAGRRLLQLSPEEYKELSPDYMSHIVLNSYDKRHLKNNSGTILRAYRKNLKEAHVGRVVVSEAMAYYSTLQFTNENAFTTSEISELAQELQVDFELQFKLKQLQQKPVEKQIPSKPELTPYEQQFEF